MQFLRLCLVCFFFKRFLRYSGALPYMHWCTNVRFLKIILAQTGSQWRAIRDSVELAYLLVFKMTFADIFYDL